MLRGLAWLINPVKSDLQQAAVLWGLNTNSVVFTRLIKPSVNSDLHLQQAAVLWGLNANNVVFTQLIKPVKSDLHYSKQPSREIVMQKKKKKKEVWQSSS